MNEATCKAALVKILRASLPPGEGRVFRHEDMFTGGVPDISISYLGRTVWCEVKLDRHGRRSKVTELQRASLKALQGFLLTFEEFRDGTFGARFEGGDLNWSLSFREKSKKCVYMYVSDFLLRRLR